MYKKYDIVLADLNPQKGSAQSGVRPCIIIQNNIFNAKSSTTLIVPLTSVLKKPFPSEFIINASVENGLSQDSRFLGSQIMTIDFQFISHKIGILEKKYYKELFSSLEIALDLQDIFQNE